jgi:hypothetical protein
MRRNKSTRKPDTFCSSNWRPLYDEDSTVLTHPYLDVEPFFDEVIARAGGYRVDTLIPRHRTFDNADYYFESEGVFAELKVLESDPQEDKRLSAHLGKLYKEYADAGRVPPLSRTQRFARSELLPIEAQWRLLQPLKRRLQVPVKKAAKQLKETKEAFKRINDVGLLILVNEGSALFQPTWVFYFLHHLFRGGYSGIDHVVYCSVNVPASVPDIPDGARVWLSAAVEGRKSIPDRFVQLLSSCWRAALEQKLGISLPLINFNNDSNVLDEVVFDKLNPRGHRKPRR